MAKKKSKANQRRLGQTERPAPAAPAAPRHEWDSVEAEFFARAADLYHTSPVESFEDLDKD